MWINNKFALSLFKRVVMAFLWRCGVIIHVRRKTRLKRVKIGFVVVVLYGFYWAQCFNHCAQLLF